PASGCLRARLPTRVPRYPRQAAERYQARQVANRQLTRHAERLPLHPLCPPSPYFAVISHRGDRADIYWHMEHAALIRQLLRIIRTNQRGEKAKATSSNPP